jgi:hypothetical protein
MNVIIAAMLSLKQSHSISRLHYKDASCISARSHKLSNHYCRFRKHSLKMSLFFGVLFGFVVLIVFNKPISAYDFSRFISTNDPYYEPIAACNYLGIIYQESGEEVRLEESLNRYQVAHITVLTLEALGVPVVKDVSTLKYHDIPASHWAVGDVAGCVNLGLMGGFEDLTFQGRSNMMKEHWLAMSSVLAVKFAPEPSPEQAQIPPQFRDLPTINWLWQPINTLGKYGWLDPSVMDDDFLNRNDSVTRKILYWYLGKLILSLKGPLDTWKNSATPEIKTEQTGEIENGEPLE